MTADRCYTKSDDGLGRKWEGRVWLNPPYSRLLVDRFITAMAEHDHGVALIFNRMDSRLWHEVIFPTASALLIIKGRLRFYRQDGTRGDAAGCGSVLVAWDKDDAEALEGCGIEGKFIKLRQ